MTAISDDASEVSRACQTARKSCPLITVAICTRNRAALLKRAAAGVMAQMYDDTELLIVDNASTDDTAEAVAGFCSVCENVRSWHEPEVGLSVARNAALARAKGEYVVFLDDDATPGPGWLAAYARFLRHPPAGRIACVGGAIFPAYEVAPPAWMSPAANRLDAGHWARPMTEHGGPWGGNCAYHRRTVIEMGGFATDLGRKGDALGVHEESELNCRLSRAGFAIWWLPQASIRHFIPAKQITLRWWVRSAFAQGRSTAIMRLRLMHRPRQRRRFRVLRVLAAPFHSSACLLAAVAMLPIGDGQRAAKFLARAVRIAGMAVQLMAWR